MTNLDLNVAAPEQVARVLRAAAEKYRESVSELTSAWQDPNAGKVWGALAKILDRAADAADKTV